jgi:hypothetical protein
VVLTCVRFRLTESCLLSIDYPGKESTCLFHNRPQSIYILHHCIKNSNKSAHPIVGKVENSREKGQYVGNVHRVLLRMKTSEDEEGVRKVEDVKLVGMVDMIGTFREPADFRFMGDTRHPKDQIDPMLTMCPLRFDGPVSSLLRSKDTTVVRRYVGDSKSVVLF